MRQRRAQPIHLSSSAFACSYSIVKMSRRLSFRARARNSVGHLAAMSSSFLRWFSVNGKAVLSRQVAGLAHVSLESLPAGRYVAKLLNSTGKPLAVKLLQIK